MPVVFWEFLYVAFMSYSYWKLVCWFDGKTKETMYEYLLKNKHKRSRSNYCESEDDLLMTNVIDFNNAFK